MTDLRTTESGLFAIGMPAQAAENLGSLVRKLVHVATVILVAAALAAVINVGPAIAYWTSGPG